MSSGTKVQPGAAKGIQNGLSSQIMANVERFGMSPRQQELNRLWAAYRGQQYSSRKIDWDGTERKSHLEADMIATGGFIPPGYYDAGSTFPLKFRRPSAPYHLRKVIVDRFTSLLFSDRKHPNLRVEDDPATEDYVRTLGEVGRLWPAMIQARTYGGSMGTVATGFQFVQGRPVFEVHDPRWCFPEFKDRHALVLKSLEKRYMYPVDERDPMSGKWVQRAYWYRRVIDEEKDVLYKPCPVEDGEPEWEVAKEVAHDFGFCPIVWTQNLPVQDDVDGDPDTMGIEDICDQIDALLSQSTQGIIANCDPTLRIITDAGMDEVRKGSNNAIKLPAGSSMDYMELSGTGPKAAVEQAEKLRSLALEVSQCVLDHPDVGGRTATEVERVYASMLAKADVLREQYGERCVKPLMEMMVKAIRIIEKPKQMPDGRIVRRAIKLPEKVAAQEDGTVQKAAREIGEGGLLNLNWGPYFDPSLDDVNKATQAASSASTAGLLDTEHAIGFLAPYFLVEDAAGMAKKIRQEQEELQAQMDGGTMADIGEGEESVEGEEEPLPPEEGAEPLFEAEPAPAEEPVYAEEEMPDLSTVAPSPTEVQAQAQISELALNGSQVASMLQIITAVATSQLPRQSGVMMMARAFAMAEEDAEAIMGEVGRTFFSEAEAPAKPKVVGGQTPKEQQQSEIAEIAEDGA